MMKNSLVSHWHARLQEIVTGQSSPDFGWKQRLEARVLRFLLARYGQNFDQKAAPIPSRPLLWPSFHAQTRFPTSRANRQDRLKHIAATRNEADATKPYTGFGSATYFDKVQAEDMKWRKKVREQGKVKTFIEDYEERSGARREWIRSKWEINEDDLKKRNQRW